MRSTWMLALTLAVLVLATPAMAADAAAVPQRDLIGSVSDKLFEGIRKLTEKLAHRLSERDDVDLTINSVEKDERNRMYIDVDGEVDIKFPIMPGKLRAYMDDLPGHHVRSDGPLNVDYTVTVCEPSGEKSYRVAFHAKLIIVLEEVLATLVRFGTNVAGTVTLIGIGRELSQVVDGINGEVLSESVHAGLQSLGKVMATLGGVEAYDAWRGFRHDRDSIGAGQSGAGMVLTHLAMSVIHGVTNVGLSVAGMSIGAALGTSLFPGVGSTVGAIVGAAAFNIVGNVVYTKLTVDLPVRYRLGRIRRMTENMKTRGEMFQAFLASQIQKQEDKMVKRFSFELRTDKFQFFDELVKAFKRMTPEERGVFASLRGKVEQKLKYEVVNRGDRLFAWKLDQLRDAFGDAPLSAEAAR